MAGIVPVVGSVIFVVAVTVSVQANAPDVAKLPPMVNVLPLLLTPVPPCAPVTRALSVRIVALAFGSANDLAVEAGPVNCVNPFPVPP